MPSRFDKYRVKDGVTRLGEAYFNPVFQDIDLRIVALEALRLSWEDAVRSVSTFGLARINEVIGPSLSEAVARAGDIELKRQAAMAALAALESALQQFETEAQAQIEAWKGQQLEALDDWRLGLTPSLPVIEGRLSNLEAAGTTVLAYDERANLRELAAHPRQRALVQGLGLFVFEPGSDEPDDDESCFATATGRWLLEAVHWDVVDAWQAFDAEERDARLDDVEGRWPGRVLFGSAVSAITSLGGNGAQASFTGSVSGASPGDRVIATPPEVLPGFVTAFARVSSPGIVTVYLSNPSAYTATLNPGTWPLTVLKSPQ